MIGQNHTDVIVTPVDKASNQFSRKGSRRFFMVTLLSIRHDRNLDLGWA